MEELSVSLSAFLISIMPVLGSWKKEREGRRRQTVTTTGMTTRARSWPKKWTITTVFLWWFSSCSSYRCKTRFTQNKSSCFFFSSSSSVSSFHVASNRRDPHSSSPFLRSMKSHSWDQVFFSIQYISFVIIKFAPWLFRGLFSFPRYIYIYMNMVSSVAYRFCT